MNLSRPLLVWPVLTRSRMAGFEVITEVEAGRFTSGAFGRPVPVRELLPTYQIRKAHLATIDSAHARRLGDDVAMLCASLELLPPDASATVTCVTFDDGRSISIRETPAHELLAVISGFDDRMISDTTRWRAWRPDNIGVAADDRPSSLRSGGRSPLNARSLGRLKMRAWGETSDAIAIWNPSGRGSESMRSFTLLVLGIAIVGGSCIVHERNPVGLTAEHQPARPSATEDKERRFKDRVTAVAAALGATSGLPPDAEPLRVATVDAYLASMHRRIHKLWVGGQLADWETLKSDSPLNNPALVAIVEITLNSDGSVSKASVPQRSGYLPFDAAAIDVVQMAAPYPPLPTEVRSADGKGYLRWPFHRDSRECSTPYVTFFIVRGRGGPDRPGS